MNICMAIKVDKWVSQVAQWKNCLLIQERGGFNPWVGKIPWRRKCQCTPVFLPGESVDRGAWRATVHGVAESDTTEDTHTVLT